ncbi:histidine kinase [Flavobacterium sp. 3HN19-14]|uniref:histidine kinase n=1 Tax=Flavobacterium sp. 3HN19-14 TaxID=3448133 RepID=UPI003EDE7C56
MKPLSIKKISLLSQSLVFFGLLLIQISPLYWGIEFPFPFWIKQFSMYILWIGIFYLTYSVLLPKLLYKGRNFYFFIAVCCILFGVVLLSKRIDIFLDLDNVLKLHFKLPEKKDHNEGQIIARFGEIIITLVIMGFGTIIGVARKLQTENRLRLELEQEKVISELSFLKSQINPHFFFNILNSIYALAGNGNEPAREAIYTLSHMMRYVLYDTKNNLTSLQKEIAFVEDYLKLMELRITDKVQVIFEKPAHISDVEIAPMLFLPFIENAYKHGISSIYPSYIYIGITQTGKELQIEVRNSVFENQSVGKEDSNGIGLVNTRRRLDLIYPGRYELRTNEDAIQKEYQGNLKIANHMILKCIAVDDEPLSLQIIVSYIQQTPSLQLTGQFSNAIEALKAIHENDIDLLFLDIRMPDINGIELAKIVEQYRVKGNLRIIFTTAFDQYALDGYKVDALDYLLKPFSFVDFSRSVNKAISYFELIRNPQQETPANVLPIVASEPAYIYLKVEYQLVKVALDDIIYIESMKDYVKVYRLK